MVSFGAGRAGAVVLFAAGRRSYEEERFARSFPERERVRIWFVHERTRREHLFNDERTVRIDTILLTARASYIIIH